MCGNKVNELEAIRQELDKVFGPMSPLPILTSKDINDFISLVEDYFQDDKPA